MLKAALFLCDMLISRAECYYTQHIIWIMRGCVGFTISPLMFILQFAQRPCKKENNILQHCIAQKSITANACRGWIRCSKHPFHAALQRAISVVMWVSLRDGSLRRRLIKAQFTI